LAWKAFIVYIQERQICEWFVHIHAVPGKRQRIRFRILSNVSRTN